MLVPACIWGKKFLSEMMWQQRSICGIISLFFLTAAQLRIWTGTALFIYRKKIKRITEKWLQKIFIIQNHSRQNCKSFLLTTASILPMRKPIYHGLLRTLWTILKKISRQQCRDIFIFCFVIVYGWFYNSRI